MSVKKALDNFGRYVVQQSKSNLTRKGKKDTSELYNSIKYEAKEFKNSFQFSISMEDYGQFVDKGVKGVGGTKADGKQWKKKKVTNNFYRYKTKRPPAGVFNGWIVRKGIAPRTSGGQFAKRKGLQFAIAESVFRTGLETTEFFTKPFERAFARLPEEIVEAYGLDVDKFLNSALNN